MKIQTLLEWAIGIFVSAAGAVGIFFTVRAAYILYLKETSVGKSAIKKRDDRIDAIEKRIQVAEQKLVDIERHEYRISRLERDSDEQHEDLQSLDDKVDDVIKELKNKTI